MTENIGSGLLADLQVFLQGGTGVQASPRYEAGNPTRPLQDRSSSLAAMLLRARESLCILCVL
ncbi:MULTISPECIES: hypothetical protein [Bradyrhizobium]